MKKILLTTILAGSSLAAFGQGGILIANANNSSAHWNLNTSSGPAAPVTGTDVQLLWYNGTSFQIVGSVFVTSATSAGTFSPGGLYFAQSTTTIIPTYAATGTFEVQGWTGNFASYAAAVAGGAYVGETASFTAGEADLGITPAQTPNGLAGPTGHVSGTEWNGDLVLMVPEPSTIALGGLGAAALLLFRRKK